MAAFRSRYRRGGRWWALGTTLAAFSVALVFVLAASAAKPGPAPSGPYQVPTGDLGATAGLAFADNDGNMETGPNSPSLYSNGATANTDIAGQPTFDWNSLEDHGLSWGTNTNGNQSGTGTDNGVSKYGGWQTLGITAPIGKASGQNSFAGGTKQDDNCPSVINQGVQNKDDLRAIYLAAKTLTSGPLSGDKILNLAWERAPQNTTSASAHVAFEFNQNKLATSACGAGSDGLVNRSTANGGDVLLVFDFTGGNTLPTLSISRWIASGTCQVGSDSPPCWSTFTDLTALAEAEANVDDGLSHNCPNDFCGPNEVDSSSNGGGSTYTLPFKSIDCLAAGSGSGPLGSCDSQLNPSSGGYPLGTSEFGEAGVDLTAAGVFGSGACISFGQVEGVSRSSGDSSQAQMEKLVGPAPFTLSNCSTTLTTTPQYYDTGSSTYQSVSGSLTAGTTVRDKATVTVTGTNTWSGNLDFYLCYDASTALTSCEPSNSNQVGGDVAVNQTTLGGIVYSSTETATNAGYYCWAAAFTHISPDGLPDKTVKTGECFTVTASTSTATRQFVYPNDAAQISASSGGKLSGTVHFRLFEDAGNNLASYNCSHDDGEDDATGLLYKEDVAVSDATSPKAVKTSNSSTAVTSNATVYWRVSYESSNTLQSDSSSVCTEYTAVTYTGNGTFDLPS
jgi:hypothetical protein